MNKINSRKKSKKKSPLKKLQAQNEKLWKQCIALRDGDECMVQKHFPLLKIHHSSVLQADHCFSRSYKELFLDIANGTRVCSSCNMKKQWDDVIRMAIYDIVRKREGEDTINRMREIAESKRAFKGWGDISWQEGQHQILEAMVSMKSFINEKG